MRYSPNCNGLGLENLANLLEAEGGNVSDRVDLLPAGRRLHFHQHSVRKQDKEHNVGQLQVVRCENAPCRKEGKSSIII